MSVNQKLATLAALPVLAAASMPALAEPVDYTIVTNAFSAADVVAGLLAIGGIVATIYVAWRGIKMIAGAMKGGL